MKVHRQTHRRRVRDNDVRAILQKQLLTGQPTDAATVRAFGIACGSCRLSRLRREVERELDAAVYTASEAASKNGNEAPATRSAGITEAGAVSEPLLPTAWVVPVAEPAFNVAVDPTRPDFAEKTKGEATVATSARSARTFLGHIRRAVVVLCMALFRLLSPQSHSRTDPDR